MAERRASFNAPNKPLSVKQGHTLVGLQKRRQTLSSEAERPQTSSAGSGVWCLPALPDSLSPAGATKGPPSEISTGPGNLPAHQEG